MSSSKSMTLLPARLICVFGPRSGCRILDFRFAEGQGQLWWRSPWGWRGWWRIRGGATKMLLSNLSELWSAVGRWSVVGGFWLFVSGNFRTICHCMLLLPERLLLVVFIVFLLCSVMCYFFFLVVFVFFSGWIRSRRNSWNALYQRRSAVTNYLWIQLSMTKRGGGPGCGWGDSNGMREEGEGWAASCRSVASTNYATKIKWNWGLGEGYWGPGAQSCCGTFLARQVKL